MKIKINYHGRYGDWGYYPNRMFAVTIPYFLFNLLDLIITKIALATVDKLHELNPFYHHPYFPTVKIFVPVLLLALYLSLYYLNKSEFGRQVVGKMGLYCLIALTLLSMIICINNVCQLAMAV
ncbi:MAG: hypothetical protein WAV32_06260 [Halobacteriota archaeon]